jgi:hypothetical protein
MPRSAGQNQPSPSQWRRSWGGRCETAHLEQVVVHPHESCWSVQPLW